MAPPLIGGGIKRWCCLTSVCLTSVAYIGPKSRTERPRKTKIGTEVARHTWLGYHFQGQKVNLQAAGHIVAASSTAYYYNPWVLFNWLIFQSYSRLKLLPRRFPKEDPLRTACTRFFTGKISISSWPWTLISPPEMVNQLHICWRIFPPTSRTPIRSGLH